MSTTINPNNSCKNCSKTFEGNFCNNCGQKTSTQRINYQYLVHEIQHLVVHVDKGFFYTLKELILKPGTAIKDYIDGKRVNFFKPTSFVIILSLVHAFLEHYHQEDPIILKFISGFY